MMSMDETLADLKQRKANLAKLAKELKADKAKEKVPAALDALIKAMEKQVDDRKSLEGRVASVKKTSDELDKKKAEIDQKRTALDADVKKWNDSLKALATSSKTLDDLVGSLRGSSDTKTKDFSGLYNDTQTIKASMNGNFAIKS